jgi:putative glutamine amidotransferase
VVLEQGSALKEIYGGASTGRINSIHHQSIKDVAPGLRVEARSPEDGIIEGVCLDDSLSKEEHHQGRYALGVQWHPEFIAPKDTSLLDPGPLMNHFLEQVRATKNQK